MIYPLNEFQAHLHILQLQSSAAWKPFVFFETCIIGFSVKNCFQNISNFLNLDYFEKIQISLITKKVNFALMIIFSYEKMFQLHPAPHHQDDYILAPFYPDEEDVCMVQGAKKIMY